MFNPAIFMLQQAAIRNALRRRDEESKKKSKELESKENENND